MLSRCSLKKSRTTFRSTSPLEGRRRLRQSGARKRGQQARVKPAFLFDIGRIPLHRLGLAAKPAPEIVFRRGTRPHPGYVTGDLARHRAHVVLPPTRGSSLGVVAGHGSHASILRQAPLDGDTRAGDRWMHGLNTPFSIGSRLRLHFLDSTAAGTRKVRVLARPVPVSSHCSNRASR